MLTSVSMRLVAVAIVATIILVSSDASMAREESIYTIAGVAVDETAQSAAVARDVALAKGQTRAFRRLINKIVPRSEHGGIPQLTPAAQVELVSGIDVEGEKTSPVRYLATLTVRFNQEAVRSLLRSNNIPFAETPGKPLIVLPVYRAAGTTQLWDAANSWLRAWQSLPPSDSLIPLIVPRGDAADIAAISPQQALIGAEDRLDAIAARYGAAGIVLADATVRRDDAERATVVEVATSRFGSAVGDATAVRSFSGGAGSSLELLLRQAAESVRADVAERWKRDNLLRFGNRQSIIATVPLAGLAQWVALRDLMGAIASVEKIELLSLSLGDATVRLIFFGDVSQLVLAFAQRDVELKQGAIDWELRMQSGNTKTATESVTTQ